MELRDKDMRGGSGIPLWNTVLSMFDIVFLASAYTVDGVSGKVSSFVDIKNSSNTLTQSNSANQCPIPAADPGLNGELRATTGGIVGYVSNQASSFWKFLQDGTGMEVWRVFIPLSASGNAYALSCRSSAAGQTGYSRFRGGAQIGLFVLDAGATVIGSTGGTVVVNTPYYETHFYKESKAPFEFEIYLKATLVQSGNSAIAPPVGNPSNTLRMGARTDGTNPETEYWAATFIAKRVLSDAERTVVRAAIAQRYGIT